MSGDNDDPMIPLDAKAAGEAPSASHGAGNGAMPPQPPPDLTEIRKQLFTRGYKILPNRGKAPVIKGWSDPNYLARELADSGKGTVLEKIERWPGRFPDAHSTGVWLWDKLRVIDIDVSDADMVKALLEAIRELAPEIANRAPMRFGAVPRIALFARAPDNEDGKKLFNDKGDLIHVMTTTFNRIGSHRYRRPEEGEDAPTHSLDIFGGEPTAKGNCSRQFGVYGPHSYNDDGTVAREYTWALGRPALHELDLADLPTLSYATACKIIDAFKALAKAAGWVWVETGLDKHEGNWAYILVDDPSMLFNDNMGGVGLRLPEVIENCPVGGSRYTVASSFIPGDTGSNVTKCLVGWSARLNCITIWNSERDITYAPADKKPVEDWSQTPLGEFLRKLRDEHGDNHGGVLMAALQWLDMSNWDNEPVPNRKWAIPDRVPLNQVGLFSGEGGTGKSIIELMKNVAHVAKGEWFGSQPGQGPTFYLGAEDDTDELHIRIAAIARHYGVTFKALVEGGLHVLPLLGKDAVLCAANPKSGRVEVTELYDQIYEAAGDLKPINISVDTLSRAFAGNEIDRVQVYAFAMHMQALAKAASGSVTILSHPSLAGMASGSGISGSTAWHGAFRFRQYLKGVKAPGAEEISPERPEPDNGLRLLEFKKNQYGPLGASIALRYENGLFLPELGATDAEKLARQEQVQQVFMQLLGRFNGQGRNAGHARTSNNYAPVTFAKETEAIKHGLRRADFEAAMRDLFAAGRIKVETYGRPSRPFQRLIAV
jgi:RecA-family ATPase